MSADSLARNLTDRAHELLAPYVVWWLAVVVAIVVLTVLSCEWGARR